jgi:hypothetical protein
MKVVSVKPQSWLMRLWMLLFPLFMLLIVFGIVTLVKEQALDAETGRFFANLGLCFGIITVLFVVALRDEVINRYLLSLNIALLAGSLNQLLLNSPFLSDIISFEAVLASVFIVTMLYSPVGFIGVQYRKKSTMIYSSFILFGLLVCVFALYRFIGRNHIFFLLEYALLRNAVLYFFDETKSCSMMSRIPKIIVGFIVFIAVFHSITLEKISEMFLTSEQKVEIHLEK